ncbi:MAG: endonuclease III [Candidatus Aegiribacteria sp.]|nr:endonuclease III [Candidatus Aegiribacteria sp.]
MNNREHIEILLLRLPLLYPDARCVLKYYGDPEKLLIATILSARTTDKSVNQVTPLLWSTVRDIKGLASANRDLIEDMVHSLGFFRSKAKSIQNAAEWLLANDGLPDTIEGLVRIPGVGRKTANVIIGEVFHKPAIIVDTHVGRLSGRLDLTRAKQPDRIEAKLRKLLPEESRTSFSHQLGFHGRAVCTSRNPSCDVCDFKEICPGRGIR